MRQRLGREPTNNEITDAHLFLRAHSPHSVRSAEAFLTEAVQKHRYRSGVGLDGREMDGPARNHAAAVRTRVNEARAVRREAPLGDDYGTAPAPGADPEAAKASRTVAAMQAQRRAARQASSVPTTVTVRRAG
jgi:hypothetical protein